MRDTTTTTITTTHRRFEPLVGVHHISPRAQEGDR
jgi:hypothetical protein